MTVVGKCKAILADIYNSVLRSHRLVHRMVYPRSDLSSDLHLSMREKPSYATSKYGLHGQRQNRAGRGVASEDHVGSLKHDTRYMFFRKKYPQIHDTVCHENLPRLILPFQMLEALVQW
ncbi:hypothetical protein PENSUB_448 [Penicillium subrubescens]|uniref:Uncharacterized protein n=1 Tax=Penicillium subrubescens TaxID=1316194 RepID=A0A1Q5UN32_9EURO|nr:hypothetical protein PENSUB_448 [Penicillium subrubescens]